jgi:hypothetical protein
LKAPTTAEAGRTAEVAHQEVGAPQNRLAYLWAAGLQRGSARVDLRGVRRLRPRQRDSPSAPPRSEQDDSEARVILLRRQHDTLRDRLEGAKLDDAVARAPRSEWSRMVDFRRVSPEASAKVYLGVSDGIPSILVEITRTHEPTTHGDALSPTPRQM